MVRVGIIGGSGLDDPDIIENCKRVEVDTPYGPPSSDIMTGVINDTQVLVLARHGRRHQYSPTQVNNRANIDALKQAGATHIIATTACGSLQAEIDRGHFVILDQFIDFTRFRKNTFADSFEQGAVHTAMAYPFDPFLCNLLYKSATDLGLNAHETGCVVTIEGPRFSTVAESRMFRLWGADVINMSTAPEVMLANEAGIPYAAVAMATDYDCWKQDESPVTWDEILSVFKKNADNVKQLFITAVSQITAMN
nr:S-methyl-5'-thioadenosine phosphorylase [uncultured Desulfobacter sp.]